MSPHARVLVVHPPTSIARDFIDYPYFSDLGAVQLAAVLREAGHPVALVDAFALPSSTLAPRDDGRFHLGAPVVDTIAACRAALGAEAPALVVVALTPFHRPPARDDVLGDVLAALRDAWPEAPRLLADCYQSGQHYVECRRRGAVCGLSGGLRVGEVRGGGDGARARSRPSSRAASVRCGAHRGASPLARHAAVPRVGSRRSRPRTSAFCARTVQNLGRARWAFPIDGRTLPLVTSRGCPFTCVHCSLEPGARCRGAPKTQRRYSGGAPARVPRAARGRVARGDAPRGPRRARQRERAPLRSRARRRRRARRALRRAERHARRLPRARATSGACAGRVDDGERERRERRRSAS